MLRNEASDRVRTIQKSLDRFDEISSLALDCWEIIGFLAVRQLIGSYR